MTKLKQALSNKRRVYGWMWGLVRYIIVFGLVFIILKPMLYKILMAFMSHEDLLNPAVNIIPHHPSLYYWKQAWEQLRLPDSFINTFLLSFFVSVLQVISCTMIGYGLGRFRFRGQNLAFVFVVLIMLVPYTAISTAQYLRFAFFGVGKLTVNLLDTFVPSFILAFTGTNINNGLYIYLMREFFRTMPGNLEEAAYIDGCGPIKAFLMVMVPNAKGMMTTTFLLSFCWQWSDSTYAQSYFSDIQLVGNVLNEIGASTTMETSIIQNAGAIIVVIPLLLLFLVFQKTLVRSIALSGLAN